MPDRSPHLRRQRTPHPPPPVPSLVSSPAVVPDRLHHQDRRGALLVALLPGVALGERAALDNAV